MVKEAAAEQSGGPPLSSPEAKGAGGAGSGVERLRAAAEITGDKLLLPLLPSVSLLINTILSTHAGTLRDRVSS